MTTEYCERTIYVATADSRRIAEAIAQLCAREGMFVIPRPKERPTTHYAAMMLESMRHNTWGVAIIPGIGWRQSRRPRWICSWKGRQAVAGCAS